MRTCPYCGAVCSETPSLQGKCPECGKVLPPPAAARPDASQADASQGEPGPQATVDLPQDGPPHDTDQTSVLQTAEFSPPAEAAAGQTVAKPTAAVPGATQAPGTGVPPGGADSDRPELMRTAGFTEADPQRIQEVWADHLASAAGSQATIKVDSTTSLGTATLVIKSRSLQPSDTAKAKTADYELLDVIGQGGMGVVYSARQASFNRMVAIKMLKPGSEGQSHRDEFVSEAVTTGDLDHPNIVPVYDLGTNEQGALFYSMKRVQGTPWQKVIRKKSQAENIEILMKVADAVAFAHAGGVVHRDLKPENVMLGAFGEVLLMDWGLALRFEEMPDGRIVSRGGGMGGTPAYMAPEMVLGPVQSIGPAADLYLLGAILYEIVTGSPPHTGKSAMGCLRAAADNVIRPTDKSGELVEIARQAMQTDPRKRFPSAVALQDAIRRYQSHSESIVLLTRAQEELAQAERTGDYQRHARAMFACQEAIALWEGNEPARATLAASKLAYARSARAKGDFDLAISLLDEDDPAQGELRAEVAGALRERQTRKQRLKSVKRVAVALAITVFVVVSAAYLEIRKQRDRAETSRQVAVAAKDLAEQKRRGEARARREADESRAAAVTARDEADRKREEAEVARREAETARRAEEYEAYVARIGLAAAKVESNAFDDARRILQQCRKSEFRHWEWGRLWFLCQRSVKTFTADGPLESVAFGPQGRRIVMGGWDGTARVVDLDSPATPLTIHHGGFVQAVAFSGDGRLVATGGSDGVARLWQAADGEAVRAFAGHQDAVISVAFSPHDRWLLTSSYDGTARLWEVASGRALATLQGHSWWVREAAFSPDATRIATASQDGRVIVWSVVDGPNGVDCKPLTEFSGHGGPVYSVAFSPDSRRIVSGGYDGRILIWSPDQVEPVDLEKRIAGISQPPPPYQALAGHDAAVSCVRFSRDGRLVVSGGHDNLVKIWDVATGKLVKSLRGHGGRVRSCDFSPDGKFVVSAGHDGRAKLWSIEGYREVRVLRGRVFRGHADVVLAAAFSPDSSRVVTASRDRTARIWDAATGKMLHELKEGHAFLATAAVFFAHGDRLLTSGGDDTVRLWNVPTGAQILALEETGRTGALALAHNNRWILTGSDDDSVKLFDAQGGQLLARLRPGQARDAAAGSVSPHRSRAPASALAFSPHDRLLAAGDALGRCRVWRRGDSPKAWSEVHLLEGHSRRITAAAFLPDGQHLLTASLDNTVACWDLETGREIASRILKHPAGVTSMALLPDGRRVFTSCDDGRLRLWDSVRAETLLTMRPADRMVHFVAVSPDGRRGLSTSSVDRTVRLWDLETGREIPNPRATDRSTAMLDFNRLGGLVWTACFAPDGNRLLTVGGNDARLWDLATGREAASFSPHGAVAAASFSPDNRLVVTASWDNSAKIWDAASGKPLRKLAGAHTGYVNSAVFSGDGTRILTASDDGTARLWDVATGRPLEVVFSGHQGRVRQAVFSPDDRLVVTASDDKTARIWDTRSGRLRRVLEGHQWPVLSAACNQDASRVLTGSEDNKAILWNAQTGRAEFTLEGHTAAVTSVAFSPDGRRALTGSRDHTAKLWDTRTGKEILTLKGHQQEVTAVSFSPCGRYVLTASRDGTAILWLAAPWQ